MSVKHKLSPFRNVGANLTAVLPLLDLGMTYKRIVLKLGGTTFTKAMITGIRIRFGGKEIWNITGSHLDALNQSRKMTANAAYLTIWFSDPAARTIVGEMIGALDSSTVDKFSMEVDIGGATAPTLEAWADLAPPKEANDPYKHTIRTMLKATHSLSAAGKFTQSVPLGSVGGSLIRGIHLFHSNVTQFDVLKDGLFLQQDGENALIQYMQDELRRSSQSGLISYDPIESDNQSEAIPTLKEIAPGQLVDSSFKFDMTVSGADAPVSYSDLYTTVDRV